MVQQGKGDFLTCGKGHQLTFIVLHNEAHPHSNIGHTLTLGAFPVHLHITAIATAHIIGHDTGHGLAQSGLAGATGTRNSRKAALFNIQINIF